MSQLQRFFEELKEYQSLDREAKKKDVNEFADAFEWGEPKKQLYVHQRECLVWLAALWEAQSSGSPFKRKMGGILADDMGMGKTIEILAYFKYLNYIQQDGPFLVIVPLQTLSEWVKQATLFEFNVVIVQADQNWTKKSKKINDKNLVTFENNRKNTVVVTTDTFVKREGYVYDIRWFKKNIPWTVIVVDEAHDKLTGTVHDNYEWEDEFEGDQEKDEDPGATSEQREKKVHIEPGKSEEKTKFKIALQELGNHVKTQIILATGTPIKTKWQELANLCSFVVPRDLSNDFLSAKFEEYYIDPLLENIDEMKDDFKTYRSIIAQIMLRRDRENFVEYKEQVKNNKKPDVKLTNTTVVLEPTEKQNVIIKDQFFPNRIRTLQNLLDHPDLLRVRGLSFRPEESAKALFLKKLIDNRHAEEDMKMLVFFTGRRIMEYMYDYYNFHNDNKDTTRGKVGMIYGSRVKYAKPLVKDQLNLYDREFESLTKSQQKLFKGKDFNPHYKIYNVIQRQLTDEDLTERMYVASREYYQQKIKEMEDIIISKQKLLKIQFSQSLEGYNSEVTTVSFSPDGKMLATGSADNTVKLWDTKTKKLSRTLQGNHGTITAVSFSTDGKILATGSADNTVKLWNVESGTEVKQALHRHQGTVTAISFSPDGKILATGIADKIVKLWDLKTGKIKQTLTGHKSTVTAISFSPDGKILATGSADNTVKLWDVKTGEVKQTLNGHDGTVTAVSFRPDGSILATGSADKTVKLWHAKTGKEVVQTLQQHNDKVTAVSFSPDGSMLVTGSADKTVKLWDTKNTELKIMLDKHQDNLKELQSKKARKGPVYMDKQAQRDLFIDGFNLEGGPYNLILIMVTAGAAGINLGEATTVVFYQSSSTPNLEAQAQGRAFRLTSKTNANVFRLITGYTTEEHNMLNPYTARLKKAFFMTRYTDENKGDFLSQFSMEPPQNVIWEQGKKSKHQKWEDDLKKILEIEPTVRAKLKRSKDFFREFDDENKQKGKPNWYNYQGIDYATYKEDDDKAQTIRSLKEEIQGLANCTYMNLPIPPDPFFRKDMIEIIDFSTLDDYMHPLDRESTTNLVEKSIEVFETIGKFNGVNNKKEYRKFLAKNLFDPPDILFQIELKRNTASFKFQKRKNPTAENTEASTKKVIKKKRKQDYINAYLTSHLSEELLLDRESVHADESEDNNVDLEFFTDYLQDESAWDQIISENKEEGWVLAKYKDDKIQSVNIFLFARRFGSKDKIRLRVIFFHKEHLHHNIEDIMRRRREYFRLITNEETLKGKCFYKLKRASDIEDIDSFRFFLKPDDIKQDVIIAINRDTFEYSLEDETIAKNQLDFVVARSPANNLPDGKIEFSTQKKDKNVIVTVKAPDNFLFEKDSIIASVGKLHLKDANLKKYPKELTEEKIEEFKLEIEPLSQDSIILISFESNSLILVSKSNPKKKTMTASCYHIYQPDDSDIVEEFTLDDSLKITIDKFVHPTTLLEVQVNDSQGKYGLNTFSVANARNHFRAYNCTIERYPEIQNSIQIETKEEKDSTWVNLNDIVYRKHSHLLRTYESLPEATDGEEFIDKYDFDLYVLKKNQEQLEYICEQDHTTILDSITNFKKSQKKEQMTLAKLLSLDAFIEVEKKEHKSRKIETEEAEEESEEDSEEGSEEDSEEDSENDDTDEQKKQTRRGADHTTDQKEEKEEQEDIYTRTRSKKAENLKPQTKTKKKTKGSFRSEEEINRFIKFSQKIFQREKLYLSKKSESDKSYSLEINSSA